LRTITGVVDNDDMCHVIARGISLCMSLIDLMSSPNFVSLLAWEMEASLCFGLPRFVPSQRHFTTIDSTQVDSILFNKDFFQSIFPDWQSPAPTSDTACTSVLDNNVTEHLVSAISLALTVGFETSVVDGCHLLFSSWNAANHGDPCLGMFLHQLPKSLSEVERILRLVEDMCGLHHLMQNIDKSSQVGGGDALSTKVQRSKSPHHRQLYFLEWIMLFFDLSLLKNPCPFRARTWPGLEPGSSVLICWVRNLVGEGNLTRLSNSLAAGTSISGEGGERFFDTDPRNICLLRITFIFNQ
jgi:hypothetical protein